MLQIKENYFYTIGHRGNEAYDPENTIASFKRAIEFGVDFLEIDLQQTKDNKVVIFHDIYLGKKTSLKGRVINYNYEEILLGEYRYFKGRSEPICSFINLLDYIEESKNKNIKLIVELKEKFSNKAIQYVLDLIEQYNMSDRVIIDSFSMKTLKKVNKLTDELFLSKLVNSISHWKIFKTDIKCLKKKVFIYKKNKIRAISLKKFDLKPEILEFFIANEIFVFGWGIKNPDQYEAMIKLKNLSGFTATHPDMQIKFRKKILGY